MVAWFTVSRCLVENLLPASYFKIDPWAAANFREAQFKVRTPKSRPSAIDSAFDLAPLHVFAHRPRAEPKHVRCFAKREQAFSNRRAPHRFLASCDLSFSYAYLFLGSPRSGMRIALPVAA
jgi:hypothetical protein